MARNGGTRRRPLLAAPALTTIRRVTGSRGGVGESSPNLQRSSSSRWSNQSLPRLLYTPPSLSLRSRGNGGATDPFWKWNRRRGKRRTGNTTGKAADAYTALAVLVVPGRPQPKAGQQTKSREK